jgi:hypothetical protein
MNAPEKPTLSLPSASEYILDNFKPTDRVAILVLNRQLGETTQRITTAEKASSPEFQAWLRYRCQVGHGLPEPPQVTSLKEESNPQSQRSHCQSRDGLLALHAQFCNRAQVHLREPRQPRAYLRVTIMLLAKRVVVPTPKVFPFVGIRSISTTT